MINLYNTPNIILFLLFIIIFVFLSVLGLYLFTLYTMVNGIGTHLFGQTYVYITVASALIGVVIAFIIYNENQKYYQAQLNVEEEASSLFILYQMISTLPHTKLIQQNIINYICNIVYVEFVDLQNGIIPVNNIETLKLAIYHYKPHTIRETEIYQQCLVTLNRLIYLRNARVNSSLNGLPAELWWVVLLGSVIVIVLTWFIHASILYKTIMTSFIAIIFASLIFLLVVLNYPFIGNFSIKPVAFQNVLVQLGKNCSPKYVNGIKCGGC
jgi:hypothetical protein